MGLPEDAYHRQINDTFTTRRWIADDTIEADGRSESTEVGKGADGEDIEEISASMRCILKFDPGTMRWEIVKSRELENECTPRRTEVYLIGRSTDTGVQAPAANH